LSETTRLKDGWHQYNICCCIEHMCKCLTVITKKTSNYIVRGNFSASFSAPVMLVVPSHPLLVIYISY
jgi:hypothetical protein